MFTANNDAATSKRNDTIFYIINFIRPPCFESLS